MADETEAENATTDRGFTFEVDGRVYEAYHDGTVIDDAGTKLPTEEGLELTRKSLGSSEKDLAG